MHNFKALRVWNLSMELAVDVNLIVQQIPQLLKRTLGEQLLKTCISIPSNIAEGCGRETDQQVRYFLNIALGSSFELETHIIGGKVRSS